MLDNPDLIMNRDLLVANLPDFTIEDLDMAQYFGGEDARNGSDAARWRQLWDFCLTFAGYDYFGGDDDAAPRLAKFATAMKGILEETGSLPPLTLSQLRACLYLEQRRLKWSFEGIERYPVDHARFVDQLLDAIRMRLLPASR